ncbi:MAG: hypothetical protein LBC95_00845, partial [Candidatus Nomurabacteria bacterium]|nr:hypothetical protein [Candidatus Nomurabacteria bacterium]
MTAQELKGLKKMDEGGEAVIYDYRAGRVLKVFKSNVKLGAKEQKIAALIKLSLPGTVVAPKEAVTVNGKFVGYTMPKINGAKTMHQLTKGKVLKATKTTNLDALEAVLRVGRTLQPLHQNGVVVGDLSDNNILYRGHDVF